MKSNFILTVSIFLFCNSILNAQIDPLRAPSKYTIAYNYSIRTKAGLNFYSKADSISANAGKLKTWPNLFIASVADTAWNMSKFTFLNAEPSTHSPMSVNPSLWRQAKLNCIPGIFKVSAKIYQARGFDLSNITFVSNFKNTNYGQASQTTI